MKTLRSSWLSFLGAFLLLGAYASRTQFPLVPPLDDVLIHFQYATAIAEGHPFHYWPQDAWSSGATSLLWPFLLVPAILVGVKGLSLYLWALLLGTFCLGGIAERMGVWLEAQGGNRLMGVGGLLFCGPLVWGSFSGMEIGLVGLGLAGMLESASRALSGERPKALPLWLGLLSLTRPEGMVIGGWFIVLWIWEYRKLPMLEIAAVSLGLLQPLLNKMGTGLWVGSSILSKQAPNDTLASEVSTLGYLWSELISNGYGRYLFGATGILLLSLMAVGSAELWGRRPKLSLLLGGAWLLPMVGMALSVPHAINHYRYLMPGLVPMMGLVLVGVQVVENKLSLQEKLSKALMLCLIANTLGWIQELADNTVDIRTQHLEAAQWLQTHTPEGERIAVNDAGFVPVLAHRPVTDLEGIVTVEALPYLQAGDGGQLALIRKTHPSYMVIFPDWFGPLFNAGCVQILWSSKLANRTISGGNEMVIGTPIWEVLESGSRPPPMEEGESIWDSVVVGDPDSENAHSYRFSDDPILSARSNRIISGRDTDGAVVVDAGRRHRDLFSFVMRKGVGSGSGRLVARIGPMSGDVKLKVKLGEKVVGLMLPKVLEGTWKEATVSVEGGGQELQVEGWVEEAAPGVNGGLKVGRWWWVGGP